MEIIDFPAPSDRPIPAESNNEAETDIEALHAEAFRDLENRLMDCVSMATIAMNAIINHRTEDRELVFAVAHTWELLEKLKRDYYASWVVGQFDCGRLPSWKTDGSGGIFAGWPNVISGLKI
jgi:hypothetical protein